MPKTSPYTMSEEQVQDIDNISDGKLVELKNQVFIKENDHQI